MSAYNSVNSRRSSGPVLQIQSTRFNHHNPLFNSPQTRPGSSTRVDTPAPPKRACMCSPTNHPGSFRCSLHKTGSGSKNRVSSKTVSCGSSSRLNMRRSAMKNSLVRIGTVEGDLVMRRALAALIRPSSHNQRRRGEFRPRGSRLSVMAKA